MCNLLSLNRSRSSMFVYITYIFWKQMKQQNKKTENRIAKNYIFEATTTTENTKTRRIKNNIYALFDARWKTGIFILLLLVASSFFFFFFFFVWI